ncbi:MAG: hypothetical protein CTY16_14615 [Methylobacter sp.]|nr:MAG: hypothetical protein CTY16_14615 [Methylobacter sp.]
MEDVVIQSQKSNANQNIQDISEPTNKIAKISLAEQWLEENREGITAYNLFVDEFGVFSEHIYSIIPHYSVEG